MITEDYVSFETAKLLKEKGFYGQYCMYYVEDGEYICHDLRDIRDYAKSIAQFDYLHRTKVPAPTLQMTMKWLREVHNIDIIAPPQYNNVEWTYSAIIFKLSIPCTEIRLNDNKAKKEEAVETAIKYCLENLI